MTLIAYDAVTAGNIPSNATHAFFYADGPFANETAVRDRCPHAVLFGITVEGRVADCCDSETGDMTPESTEAWVAARLAEGAYRPVVYANADRWSNVGLYAALEHYGSRIRRWVAHYDGVAEVPAGYDLKQYETGDVDVNVCLDDAFDGPPTPPHKHAAEPHGKAHFAGTLDLANGSWTIHGTPGLDVRFVDDRDWVAEVKVSGGKWAVKGLPRDAKPLGS